jgi:hypothetical protein
MDLKRTQRGFLLAEFADRNGCHCSIQESSLATEEAIWLGMDTWYDGSPVGPQDEVTGFYLGGRMHLTREMVQELLPLLEYFAQTGAFPAPQEADDGIQS